MEQYSQTTTAIRAEITEIETQIKTTRNIFWKALFKNRLNAKKESLKCAMKIEGMRQTVNDAKKFRD